MAKNQKQNAPAAAPAEPEDLSPAEALEQAEASALAGDAPEAPAPAAVAPDPAPEAPAAPAVVTAGPNALAIPASCPYLDGVCRHYHQATGLTPPIAADGSLVLETSDPAALSTVDNYLLRCSPKREISAEQTERAGVAAWRDRLRMANSGTDG